MQLPTLSDLLSAYSNNGAGQAVQSLQQGVQGGMQLAAQRAKVVQDQANTAQQLATAKQVADAQTKDAESKFTDPLLLNSAVNGQALPAGAPVPVSLGDAILKANQARDANQQHSQDLHFSASEASKRAAESAAEKSADRAAASASMLQGKREGNVDTAAKDLTSLPWYTGALHAVGIDTPAQKAAQDTYNSQKQAAGFGAPATVTITASDGTQHVLPAANLAAARQRDPGLKVNQ